MIAHTVSSPITFQGTGLHTGVEAQVCIRPAPQGHGLRFYRSSHQYIVAHHDHVVQTQYCTVLGWPDGSTLLTVEHLLAALWSLNITDARIEVTGPEIPILDGGCQEFCEKLSQALHPLKLPVTTWTLAKPVTVRNQESWIILEPSHELSIHAEAFITPRLSHEYSYTHSPDDFVKHIAAARTTSTEKVVKTIQSRGLAKGGSLENALVLDDHGRPLNPKGMKLSCEMARHKILDILGDLALCGFENFHAHITTYGPGHTLTHKVREQLLQIGKCRLLTMAWEKHEDYSWQHHATGT